MQSRNHFNFIFIFYKPIRFEIKYEHWFDDEDSDKENDCDENVVASSDDLKKQQEQEKQLQLILVQKSKVNYLKDTLEFIRQ